MQLHAIVALLLPALATVQAGCYSSGSLWPGQNQGSNAVNAICNAGRISGYFNQGQTKYACVQLTDVDKAEFWVQWKGKGGLTLNDGDCRLRLGNEVGGCQRGGETTTADWYFRSDPDKGKC